MAVEENQRSDSSGVFFEGDSPVGGEEGWDGRT